MTTELRQARAEDIPELGRICYEAFKDLADRHGFPTDFATIEFAQQVVGMLVSQEQVHSIAAYDGDTAKGKIGSMFTRSDANAETERDGETVGKEDVA